MRVVSKLSRYTDRKDFDKNKFMKRVIIPCMLVLIGSLIFYFWFYGKKVATARGIDYIASYMTKSGELRDYSNKIGMHDPTTDIKWFQTDDKIKIEFGRVYLTWEPDDFYEDETEKQLEKIQMTRKIIYKKDGTKEVKIYYQGREIERWVE